MKIIFCESKEQVSEFTLKIMVFSHTKYSYIHQILLTYQAFAGLNHSHEGLFYGEVGPQTIPELLGSADREKAVGRKIVVVFRRHYLFK